MTISRLERAALSEPNFKFIWRGSSCWKSAFCVEQVGRANGTRPCSRPRKNTATACTTSFATTATVTWPWPWTWWTTAAAPTGTWSSWPPGCSSTDDTLGADSVFSSILCLPINIFWNIFGIFQPLSSPNRLYGFLKTWAPSLLILVVFGLLIGVPLYTK